MTLSISTYKHKVETIKEAECILRDQHYMIRRNVRGVKEHGMTCDKYWAPGDAAHGPCDIDIVRGVSFDASWCDSYCKPCLLRFAESLLQDSLQE